MSVPLSSTAADKAIDRVSFTRTENPLQDGKREKPVFG
jgi:hypothetical protein